MENSWYKIKQIETFIGEIKENMSDDEMKLCRKKLIVLHECDDKEALISQLKTMIIGLECNFESFAS